MQHPAGSRMPDTQRLADLLSVIRAEEKLLRELGSDIAAIAVIAQPAQQNPIPGPLGTEPDDTPREWRGRA